MHHNVGGLPEKLGFELIEPLRELFKDEVRKLGIELGLPEDLVWRHPFPGPGLAVRCLGAVDASRLVTLRAADAIVVEEIQRAGLYRQTSQAFAVLLPIQSVGVMGDARTYENAVAVRCIESEDFMTADWSHLPTRTAGKNLQSADQRGTWHQSCRLRHQQQAASDNRMGIKKRGRVAGNNARPRKAILRHAELRSKRFEPTIDSRRKLSLIGCHSWVGEPGQ